MWVAFGGFKEATEADTASDRGLGYLVPKIHRGDATAPSRKTYRKDVNNKPQTIK